MKVETIGGRQKRADRREPMAGNTYGVSVIARVLMLGERRVQQLAREEIIPKAARGQYDLIACVQGYVAWLQKQIERRQAERSDEYDVERTRRERANAELAELTLRVRKEELVDRADSELALVELASTITTRLRTVPTTTAPLVRALKTTRQIEEVLRNQIDSALQDLASAGTALTDKEPKRRPRAARSGAGDDASAAANRRPRVGGSKEGSQSGGKR